MSVRIIEGLEEVDALRDECGIAGWESLERLVEKSTLLKQSSRSHLTYRGWVTFTDRFHVVILAATLSPALPQGGGRKSFVFARLFLI